MKKIILSFLIIFQCIGIFGCQKQSEASVEATTAVSTSPVVPLPAVAPGVVGAPVVVPR